MGLEAVLRQGVVLPWRTLPRLHPLGADQSFTCEPGENRVDGPFGQLDTVATREVFDERIAVVGPLF